jgi:hypothetical protein
MNSRIVWVRIPAVVLVATACSYVELPGGSNVRVIHETLPSEGRGAYILIYRTSVSPNDCATIVKELAAVWEAVRPRVDQSKAPFASIIAETSSGASAIVTYGKPAESWKQTQHVWGCVPPE